jgi:hypothetical protein
MKLNKKRKGCLLDAFKWANLELKTGRSILAIVFSWGVMNHNDLIEYYEFAKEMGEEKICKALKKESVNIKTYERGLLAVRPVFNTKPNWQ